MTGKPKPDALLGLSMNEARLILLANYLAGDAQKVSSTPHPNPHHSPSPGDNTTTTTTNQVDYEKLAQLGGYKTSQSANVMYRSAKRKLSEFDPGNPVTLP